MASTLLQLLPYDPAWAAQFAAETERLRAALGDRARHLEHIGSTSVPGLLAKPVIDVGIAVESEQDADACIAPMEALGYEYRGQYGEDPRRRYYVLDRDGRRAVQVHLWMLPATGWEDQLRFRDLLRRRPELVAAYSAEKRRVAAAVNWDKRAYSEAKGPFIRAVLDASQPG